jgi:CheY-like chemotaxis protein
MRLGQIVTNLISNAAKYTDKGGEISVLARAEGQDVVISIKDNGIGMAPEMLPMIFDMFVQAPQSSERKLGGLGLGLAIVRTLVAMHGGTVVARSAGLGHGSEFLVRIPAGATLGHASPDSQKVTTKRVAARPKRVLVVDDNEDAASLLAEVLESNGHHVGTAFDGPSALDAAVALNPEVAVLDIGLPVMDGYELAERLRARQPGLRQLIALSGYGQPSDRERSAAAGFAVHIAKPVSVDELLRLLEEPA